MKASKITLTVSKSEDLLYVDMSEEEYKSFLLTYPKGLLGYDDVPVWLILMAFNGIYRQQYKVRVDGKELTMEDRQRWVQWLRNHE